MKKISVLLLILSAILLSSCQKNAEQEVLGSLSEGSFLVGYSNIIDEGSALVLYDKEGKALKQSPTKGFDFKDSTSNEESYFIVGNRDSNHPVIDKQTGEISTIEHPDGVEVEDGAFFIESEQNYTFYDANVSTIEGYEGKYMSHLVMFQDGNQSEKKVVNLPGVIEGARFLNGNLYALSEDDGSGEGIYISIIDTGTNEVKESIKLPLDKEFFASAKSKDIFKKFNKGLLLGIRDVNEEKDSEVIFFNAESKKIEHHLPFDRTFVPAFIAVHDDMAYVVGENYQVKVIDSSFDVVNEYTLEENGIAGKEVWEDDFVVKDDKVHILYSVDTENGVTREMVIYDLLTGKKIDSVVFENAPDRELAELIVLD